MEEAGQSRKRPKQINENIVYDMDSLSKRGRKLAYFLGEKNLPCKFSFIPYVNMNSKCV